MDSSAWLSIYRHDWATATIWVRSIFFNYSLVGTERIRKTVCHPALDGLDERFHHQINAASSLTRASNDANVIANTIGYFNLPKCIYPILHSSTFVRHEKRLPFRVYRLDRVDAVGIGVLKLE